MTPQPPGSVPAEGDAAALLGVGLSDVSAGARPAFTPPTVEDLAAAFPQFEILELIGQGGMGAVYRVRQRHLDREVALKLLSPALGQEPAFVDRFTREARALARLSHPHLVTIHDFGTTGGWCWLLMELVDGANMREVMRTGALSPVQALALVPPLCDALQYAHDEGVVHRDIKPENLLLDRRGRIRIADFGLAKLRREGDGTPLTASGDLLGTYHYMAPEQIEDPRSVDHRADIYSLGVVVYEMLTGGLPLGRFDPPSSRVPVDVRIDEVVLKALAKNPEHRWQRAGDVQDRVSGIAATPAGDGPAPATTDHAEPSEESILFCGLALLGGGVLLAATAGLQPTAGLGIAALLFGPGMAIGGIAILLRRYRVVAFGGALCAIAAIPCFWSIWQVWPALGATVLALGISGKVTSSGFRHARTPSPGARTPNAFRLRWRHVWITLAILLVLFAVACLMMAPMGHPAPKPAAAQTVLLRITDGDVARSACRQVLVLARGMDSDAAGTAADAVERSLATELVTGAGELVAAADGEGPEATGSHLVRKRLTEMRGILARLRPYLTKASVSFEWKDGDGVMHRRQNATSSEILDDLLTALEAAPQWVGAMGPDGYAALALATQEQPLLDGPQLAQLLGAHRLCSAQAADLLRAMKAEQPRRSGLVSVLRAHLTDPDDFFFLEEAREARPAVEGGGAW